MTGKVFEYVQFFNMILPVSAVFFQFTRMVIMFSSKFMRRGFPCPVLLL